MLPEIASALSYNIYQYWLKEKETRLWTQQEHGLWADNIKNPIEDNVLDWQEIEEVGVKLQRPMLSSGIHLWALQILR